MHNVADLHSVFHERFEKDMTLDDIEGPKKRSLKRHQKESQQVQTPLFIGLSGYF